MGLFKHKSKEDEIPKLPELPQLPELPGLPEFEGEEEKGEDSIHQLPSFPKGSFGNKFSQDTIKEAVLGGKESDEGYADDLSPVGGMDKMQEPGFERSMRKGPLTREIGEDEEMEIPEKIQKKSPMKKGPVFVRLDKFEDSQEIFEDTKKELDKISKLLKQTKEIKLKEEETLQEWEKELQHIRTQIEKVDRDLFSKI